MRVLVVDDVGESQHRLCELLNSQPDIELLAHVHLDEAYAAISARLPDLVFLAAGGVGAGGFGVLDMLGPERGCEVIITSSAADLAVQVSEMQRAFEAQALDYLRQPVREVRFRAAVRHARERLHARWAVPAQNERARMILTQISPSVPNVQARIRIMDRDGSYRFVDAADVFALAANGDHVVVLLSKESLVWKTTLRDASRQLDRLSFLRVHRSFIVNVARVRRILPIGKGEFFLELENGRRIGTGRSYRAEVEQLVSE